MSRKTGFQVASYGHIVGAPPGPIKVDDWVRVTGRIYPIGDEVIVDAAQGKGVARRS